MMGFKSKHLTTPSKWSDHKSQGICHDIAEKLLNWRLTTITHSHFDLTNVCAQTFMTF
jgi:hypothetical protein